MCVKKIVCLAMCVKKIDCRQPADLYIKKTAKKIKRRPKLFLTPLGQQFHLIGILYILPHLNKHEKQSTIYYSCYLGLHVQDNIMVAVELCPGKKSLSLPPRGKNCLLLIREKKNSLVFCWK